MRIHATPAPTTGTLTGRLRAALRLGSSALDDLPGAEPVDQRDRLLALAEIHDLHCAPIDLVGPAVRWQHHPAVAELKSRLEAAELESLDRAVAERTVDEPDDAVAATRTIARRDLVPPVYDWLADEATWDELVEFLALEGGPDGGFDDLVAICQVGALGLLEMQAGPRCRRVLRTLERLSGPEGALPFYDEHARVDPHHGKAWLDEAIAPLAQDPTWSRGMVRGALWRSAANAAFFADMDRRFTARTPAVSACAPVG